MTRRAYTPEEELSGQRTFVTDKSKQGLPTDIDREKEQALPAGAATPNSPKKQDDAGGGRNLPSYSFNGPASGESGPAESPRSLPTPGEHEGSPTKFDYNYVTRRSMHAAYKQRRPWKRQKRQKVWDRLDDKQYYQQNKAQIAQRMRVWYKQVRRNRNYQTLNEDRQENPRKYERKRVGEDTVTATTEHEAYTPWAPSKRRHKVRGPARFQRRRRYIKDRSRARARHRIWYQRNKNKPAFKRRQKMRRLHPSRFRMRPAAYVPRSNIWVVFGPDMTLARVDSVDPDNVAFTPVEGDVTCWLTPQAFLHGVVFLSDMDAEAMFSVLDEHGGEDPYGSPSQDDLLSLMDLYGVPPTDPLPADPETLVVLAQALVEEAMTKWGWDEAVGASHVAGAVMLYDQRSPEEGQWERPETTPFGSPSGPGQWTKRDPSSHEPTPGGMPHVDVNDSGGSGKVVPQHLKHAATLDEILRHTAPDVIKRAKGVKVSLSRADPKGGFWTFKARGSEGKSYTVRVKAQRTGNTKDVSKLQVLVSCDCDFFRWQGPEHWGRANAYLYGKPRGTASAPTEKDPQGRHWACKHLVHVLDRFARKYRVAGVDAPWPRGALVVPVAPGLDYLASRVAQVYLAR